MADIQTLTAEAFATLNTADYTVLDVRDDAEVLVHPLPGTV